MIHRDYRLNRDIVIRIFDDRITVESPGALPGTITPANVERARSKARNPLIAQNLREFPVPPNIDDGEGVRMMFGEMAAAHLYPPQYRQTLETAAEGVAVTLLNEERPPAWVNTQRLTAQAAEDRNDPAARLADQIVIAHASPDGRLSHQQARWVFEHLDVVSIETPG